MLLDREVSICARALKLTAGIHLIRSIVGESPAAAQDAADGQNGTVYGVPLPWAHLALVKPGRSAFTGDERPVNTLHVCTTSPV